jgi:hypothetical protein
MPGLSSKDQFGYPTEENKIDNGRNDGERRKTVTPGAPKFGDRQSVNPATGGMKFQGPEAVNPATGDGKFKSKRPSGL